MMYCNMIMPQPLPPIASTQNFFGEVGGDPRINHDNSAKRKKEIAEESIKKIFSFFKRFCCLTINNFIVVFFLAANAISSVQAYPLHAN